MDTKTLTLSEFLLARIEEREAAARAALRDDDGASMYGFGRREPRTDDGRWSTGDHEMYEQRVTGIGITIYDEGGHTTKQAQHIALNDPAYVIADCEAKRRIVELHAEVLHYEAEDTGRVVYCATCGDELDPLDPDRLPASYPCPTLRLLTLPYADHPDYDESWRPLGSAARERKRPSVGEGDGEVDR